MFVRNSFTPRKRPKRSVQEKGSACQIGILPNGLVKDITSYLFAVIALLFALVITFLIFQVALAIKSQRLSRLIVEYMVLKLELDFQKHN